MADPTSMAMVGMAGKGLGSLVDAGGQLFSGKALSDMYKYQAGIATLNSQIAEQNARYSLQKGEIEAQSSGMKTRYQIGQTTADQAVSGIDVNKGSGVAVRASEQAVGNMDQAILRSNAAKAAYGYRVQGRMDIEQARVDQFAAKNAQTASYINAASSILGGAGSVADKWTAGQSKGLWSGSSSGSASDFDTTGSMYG
jgi:hypothetical protein